jgi:hypothetical protein
MQTQLHGREALADVGDLHLFVLLIKRIDVSFLRPNADQERAYAAGYIDKIV